jgi:hypothetical protein
MSVDEVQQRVHGFGSNVVHIMLQNPVIVQFLRGFWHILGEM